MLLFGTNPRCPVAVATDHDDPLVAALGLLPAAFSTGVGSDTQKPFALVIVGGLFSRLLISVFLMPVLYAMFARDGDHLEVYAISVLHKTVRFDVISMSKTTNAEAWLAQAFVLHPGAVCFSARDERSR